MSTTDSIIDGCNAPDSGGVLTPPANTAAADTPTNGTPRNGSRKASTRRPGGQRGNSNSQRHGLRSAKLPRDRRHIEYSITTLRRSLEAETRQRYGRISPMHAALISTAIRQETTAQLAEAWLRTQAELSLADRRALREDVGRATEARDKAIERLQLEPAGKGGAGSLGDLYGHGNGHANADSFPAVAARLRASTPVGVQVDAEDVPAAEGMPRVGA